MRVLWVLLILGSAVAAEPGTATVKQAVVNLFSGPSADRDVVSQAILGMNITVVEDRGAWVRVRTPDEYEGWAASEGIVRGGTYGERGDIVMVESLFANIYGEPNVTRHAPWMTAPFEARLEVVERRDSRWAKVRLPDQREGWVQLGDVGSPDRVLSVAEMIELAKRFLGLPYTWGGTSSFGYDCSGFTQMLCRRRNVRMPRDSDDQAAWSGLRPVSREELQAGDLLYFGSSIEKIGHTGMYLGGGEFIHATTSGRPVVQISRLEGGWAKALVAMRRPR
jgi:cell wall-associated NlpC family hydrolase